MSELAQLLTGLVLLVLGFGMLVMFRPRDGKPLKIVRTPILGPALPIAIVVAFAMGLMMVAVYFTALDESSMFRGKKKASLPGPVEIAMQSNG